MSSVSALRRSQILEVALTAFSTSGYHNTSMNDIADALSMTKPVVYQYFDSKRALYLELCTMLAQILYKQLLLQLPQRVNHACKPNGE